MTQLVGILNVTPDSFSDGGHYHKADAAIRHAEYLIKAGATVLDVGAESTRPHATALSAEEEWARLAPVLPALISLCHEHHVTLSVDTRHAQTAQQAIAAGANWINDVGAASNPALLEVVAAHAHVNYVLMHSLTIPANPAVTLPEAMDVITEITAWAEKKIAQLAVLGMAKERIILDAGLGFGKTAVQSLALLWRMQELKSLGCQLLVGHSRKSFLKLFSPDMQDRDALTLMASAYLMQQQIDYLRVHNIHSHVTLMQSLSTKACV